MPKKEIKGRIIRILDTRTVIINLGREHGVSDQSIFYILGEPEPIIDPVTSETLGTVNVTKGRVKAMQVLDKFSIATSSWTEYNIAFTDLIGGARTQTSDEGGELRVVASQIQPWKARSESPVKVGDVVEVSVYVNEESEEEEGKEPDATSAETQTEAN